MMSTGPISVSVITPCYNGARFLRATLESALSQTRPPLEIIVIDDGSTDDSADIAESFGSPVRVFRQANQGESIARNRGLAEARGSHVLFLDADDLLERESLERLAAAIRGSSDAVALMGCAWFREDPTRPYQNKIPGSVRFFPEIIESNLMPPHCWLVSRQAVLDAGGFLPTLQWFEDWDLWWRIGLQGPVLVPVDYLGALYRQHAGSQLATTKPEDRARGHARLMERMAGAFLARPDLLQRHGSQLFWSCWTALSRAHSFGVRWSELEDLARRLSRVVRETPSGIVRSRTANMVRLLGPRAAVRLARAFARERERV